MCDDVAVPNAPFPIIGFVAPLLTSLLLWWATGSTFALLGAVIAPTMVVAHFVDGLRRSRSIDRERDRDEAKAEAVATEVFRARERERVAELNRVNPAVDAIAVTEGWVPARNGSTVVRAGHHRDGSPWLVNISGGVSVVGDGVAAESVWSSMTVHGVAQLGDFRELATEISWAPRARIVRGLDADAELIIRCSGSSVDTVTNRGGLPATGDWVVDDTTRARDVLARCRPGDDVVRFDDRALCSLGFGLSRAQPFVLEPTSATPHFLIAGRTGSGKSVAFTALLLDWAERFAPRSLTILGFDFKGGATFGSLKSLPHLASIVTDLDDDIMPRALLGLAAEIRRRERVFAEHGWWSIDDSVEMPRLIVAIDEVHELVRRHPDSHDVLADIARRGRSLGVHLVLSVQQPGGVLRDSLLSNVSVRIVLATNTPFDSAQVLGQAVTIGARPGHALVTVGDGIVHDVRVRWPTARDAECVARAHPQTRLEPPWLPVLTKPVPRSGRVGFTLADDVVNARYVEVVWRPSDGDVAVIGGPGSGKSTALGHLVSGMRAQWVREPSDLDNDEAPLIVLDDLDRLVSRCSTAEALALGDAFRRRRAAPNRAIVLYSSETMLPRIVGVAPNVLTLRTETLDGHCATGAAPSLWIPQSAPGAGTWRGMRVVLYDSTDSTETESIP